MSPQKIAQLNLCDYIAQVESRVITPMQATPELKAGTRQFRAVIWHKGDDVEVSHDEWTTSRPLAFGGAEVLLAELEARLEGEAEEAEEGIIREWEASL
jgi:hypothetical protein